MRNIQQESPHIIRAMLLCPVIELKQEFEQHFSTQEHSLIKLVETTQFLEDCRTLLQKSFPDVILLVDIEQNPQWTSGLLQLCRELEREQQRVKPILLVSSLKFDTHYLQNAMEAGVRKVIQVEHQGTGKTVPLFKEIDLAIWQVFPTPTADRLDQEKRQNAPGSATTITLFSTKGGVGKSTLATALAGEIARQKPEKKVVIVDLNLQCGAIAPILGVLKPKRTLPELVDMKLAANPMLNILEHLPSRDVGQAGMVHLVAAPLASDELRVLSSDDCSALLAALRRTFDFIIVDLPPQITDATVATLSVTDFILLVCTPEMLAVRATRQALKLFKSGAIPLSPTTQLRIVLNKVVQQGLISASDLEELFPDTILARFPSDSAFLDEHLNRGIPIGCLPPNRHAGKCFLIELKQLYKKLFDQAAAPKPLSQTSRPTSAKPIKPYNRYKLGEWFSKLTSSRIHAKA